MSDVAHLGHVEIYTDRFDESLDFFTRVYGLTESGRDENSAYLRAFDDYEFHSLKLTRHHTTGVGHIGYREPAGNRVELANAGARLILDPNWETVVWTEDDRKKGQARGLKTIETFHSHGTPAVQKQAGLCQEL